MVNPTTNPPPLREAEELLALWEAAEDEDQHTNYANIQQNFRELSGGWEADLYISHPDTNLSDDNVFLRFSQPSHRWYFIVYIHTGDDPLYFIFSRKSSHAIYSHELPQPRGR